MLWKRSTKTEKSPCPSGRVTLARWIGAAAGSLLLLVGMIAMLRAWGPQPVGAQSPTQSHFRADNRQWRPKDAPAATDVVAVVNNEAITKQQLAQECLRRYGEDMLESMVNKQLILDACRQQGIQVTRQDIDEEVQSMAAKFNLSVDRWLKLLEEERNIPAEKYRREIIWPMIALRRLAAGDIQVSEDELQMAFEAEYGPKVRVRLIAAKTRSDADRVLALAQAEPEKFGQLAKEHSIDPNSGAARGIIPPIRKHVGDPTVEKVAFGLKEGEISPVVEAAGQF